VAQGYQQPHEHESAGRDADATPMPALALRRHTDRCFFDVEEVVEEPDGSVRGYIVAGHLIDKDDVAELRRTPSPGCDLRTRP